MVTSKHSPSQQGVHSTLPHGIKSHPDLGELHHFNPPLGVLGRLLKPVLWIWGGSKHSGVACMALSSLAYSIMGLVVKLLAGKLLKHSWALSTVLLRYFEASC
jgi:hypothetical protein